MLRSRLTVLRMCSQLTLKHRCGCEATGAKPNPGSSPPGPCHASPMSPDSHTIVLSKPCCNTKQTFTSLLNCYGFVIYSAQACVLRCCLLST